MRLLLFGVIFAFLGSCAASAVSMTEKDAQSIAWSQVEKIGAADQLKKETMKSEDKGDHWLVWIDYKADQKPKSSWVEINKANGEAKWVGGK